MNLLFCDNFMVLLQKTTFSLISYLETGSNLRLYVFFMSLYSLQKGMSLPINRPN